MKNVVIEEFKQTLEVISNIIKPELEGYFSKILKLSSANLEIFWEKKTLICIVVKYIIELFMIVFIIHL